jgi:hypothetical protein
LIEENTLAVVEFSDDDSKQSGNESVAMPISPFTFQSSAKMLICSRNLFFICSLINFFPLKIESEGQTNLNVDVDVERTN